MKKIEFKRTAHTMLNNGIIGVYDYLKKAEKEDRFIIEFKYQLKESGLQIECEELFTLLEELYYWMGEDYYDTVTLKQDEEVEKKGLAKKSGNYNLYFNTEEDRFVPFPKITNYGLPILLTNGRPKNTKNEENQTTIDSLKKSDKSLAELIKSEFKDRGLKLGSVVYKNEPYTTIPRLEKLQRGFFEEGKKTCFWTGESYKKLVDINNNSPFIKKQGINNFKPFFKNAQSNISWKAMYLIRFSPVHAFYHYGTRTKKETILHSFFFESANLKELNDILHRVELKKDLMTLKSNNYYSNISPSLKDIYTENQEVILVLLYTLYRKVIKNYSGSSSLINDLFQSGPELPRFTLIGMQSNSFQTLRPIKYININRAHIVVNMLHTLEKNSIQFSKVFGSLKLLKPSQRQSKDQHKKLKSERLLRNKVSDRFLKGQSILDLIEDLFVRCYGYTCSNEPVGFKDYNQLFKFLQLYELKVNAMDEQLQQLAIKLGQQIGIKMKSADASADDKTNAKNGRGDLFSLRKARTQKQFLDELIRIDFKYGLKINDELALKINENNYYTIKQFLIIGALNVLNPIIHPYSKTEKAK